MAVTKMAFVKRKILLPLALCQFALLCIAVDSSATDWRIVDQWNAIPSGPTKDINSLAGCQDLCGNTTGCTQFT